jgi:hypothetical protein
VERYFIFSTSRFKTDGKIIEFRVDQRGFDPEAEKMAISIGADGQEAHRNRTRLFQPPIPAYRANIMDKINVPKGLPIPLKPTLPKENPNWNPGDRRGKDNYDRLAVLEGRAGPYTGPRGGRAGRRANAALLKANHTTTTQPQPFLKHASKSTIQASKQASTQRSIRVPTTRSETKAVYRHQQLQKQLQQRMASQPMAILPQPTNQSVVRSSPEKQGERNRGNQEVNPATGKATPKKKGNMVDTCGKHVTIADSPLNPKSKIDMSKPSSKVKASGGPPLSTPASGLENTTPKPAQSASKVKSTKLESSLSTSRWAHLINPSEKSDNKGVTKLSLPVSSAPIYSSSTHTIPKSSTAESAMTPTLLPRHLKPSPRAANCLANDSKTSQVSSLTHEEKLLNARYPVLQLTPASSGSILQQRVQTSKLLLNNENLNPMYTSRYAPASISSQAHDNPKSSHPLQGISTSIPNGTPQSVVHHTRSNVRRILTSTVSESKSKNPIHVKDQHDIDANQSLKTNITNGNHYPAPISVPKFDNTVDGTITVAKSTVKADYSQKLIRIGSEPTSPATMGPSTPTTESSSQPKLVQYSRFQLLAIGTAIPGSRNHELVNLVGPMLTVSQPIDQ